MIKRPPLLHLLIESVLPWLVLTFLLAYTYILFFQVPYPGFGFTPSRGTVRKILVTSAPSASLQEADQFIQIGPVAWADFQSNLRQTLFDGVQPGQIVPIIIERQGEQLTIPWVFPGPSQAEVLYRLNSGWFLGYIFWLAGTITLLFLRPKDTRWRLLIAFNFLTALWLTAGNISRWHLWESAILLRGTIWLSMPVYWHLHWAFPQPLGRLPAKAWWLAYLIAGLLAIAEWFQFLPNDAYFLGLFLGLAGSMVLLIVHFILQPMQRRDVGLLVLAVILVLAPSIAISIAGSLNSLPLNAPGAFLTLPILPFAYLYATYRRQLGGLELRTNRFIASYIYFTLLGGLLLILIAAADRWLNFRGEAIFIGVVAALLAALIAAISLGPFQRLIEHRVLGIPLPPSQLLEAYAARITVSLDSPTLINLLNREILSSLLIRQSALLRLEEGKLVTFYANGFASDQLPRAEDLPDLLAQAGKFRAPTEEALRPCPWRLILLLRIEQKPIGLWLLGRRDPDDFYAQAEIDILQSLAHQTAIALVNIFQAERLHALYQADIDRVETQRAGLARELHDNVLNQLAVLKTSIDENDAKPSFLESYETVIASLRQTISGLRPAMLNYGLVAALTDLTDDLAERYDHGGLEILLELPDAGARYDPQFEQHIYRIIQQACENALQHADPKTIKILGRLEPGQIDLTVEDDGVGFNSDEQLDLARLATGKHFGLAGMFERAALVKAQVQIDSAPGRGTRVRVTWTASNGTSQVP